MEGNGSGRVGNDQWTDHCDQGLARVPSSETWSPREGAGSRPPHALLVGVQNGATAVENSMTIPREVTRRITVTSHSTPRDTVYAKET